MKLNKIKAVTILIACVFLLACNSKGKSEEMLAEKGIQLKMTENADNSEKLSKLDLFWSDFPCVEKEISLDLQETLSFEFYLELLIKSYNEVNYGGAYGLTEYLCKEYDLCEIEVPDSLEIKEEELFVLDLSMPLFDERIVDNSLVEKAKAISYFFSEYVIRKYGIAKMVDITVFPDNKEIELLKNEWLHSLGYEYDYSTCSCSYLRISQGDEAVEYPYCVESESYMFYFSLDDILLLGYQDYFGEFSRIETLIEEDFEDARTKFWKYKGEVVPVRIYTNFSKTNPLDLEKLAGCYSYDDDCILLFRDWTSAEYALVHEYIHYLDKEFHNTPEMNMYQKKPLLEAYTSEIASYECSNKLMQEALLKMYGEDFLKQLGVINDGVIDNAEYTELIAGIYFAEYRDDYVMSATASNNKVVHEIIPWDYLPSQINGSFFHFIMEKYGRDRIIELSYNTEKFSRFVAEDYENDYSEWVSITQVYYDGYIKKSESMK